MRGRVFDLLIGGLAGVLLAGAFSTVCYDRKVKSLQAFSDRVATSSAAITARANARADSLRQRSDSLARLRQPVIRQVERDTVTAELARRSLAAARTVRDTNVALWLENQGLRQAMGGLFVALHQADEIIALERARGDSLKKALGDVNLQLQSLNVRVQQLKPPPRWLRYSWEAVKLAGVAKLAYDAGRRDR